MHILRYICWICENLYNKNQNFAKDLKWNEFCETSLFCSVLYIRLGTKLEMEVLSLLCSICWLLVIVVNNFDWHDSKSVSTDCLHFTRCHWRCRRFRPSLIKTDSSIHECNDLRQFMYYLTKLFVLWFFFLYMYFIKFFCYCVTRFFHSTI